MWKRGVCQRPVNTNGNRGVHTRVILKYVGVIQTMVVALCGTRAVNRVVLSSPNVRGIKSNWHSKASRKLHRTRDYTPQWYIISVSMPSGPHAYCATVRARLLQQIKRLEHQYYLDITQVISITQVYSFFEYT